MIFIPGVALGDVIVPIGTQSVPKMCNIIPSGTIQFVAVFEAANYTCERGYYLPQASETCVICPANHFCPGGDYIYSETDTQGLFDCESGAYAPAGMWDVAQCGRRLHIDNAVIYMGRIKRTNPALHLDIDHDGVADYYANLTKYDVPMSNSTDKKLKIKLDGVVYSVYDDTINLDEYISK